MLEKRELILPISGMTVQVSNRRMKVRDNDAAFAMVKDPKKPMQFMVARATLVLSRPDGSKFTFEEVFDWWEEDLNAVTELREDPDFLEKISA